MNKELRIKNNEEDPRQRREVGFSLLELVVVIAIIVILGLAVVLVLKPAQMLGRARDATRISDMVALTDALELAQADAPITEFGGFDVDGSFTDTCKGETTVTQTVYVSVPNSESVPDNLPPGWVYKQVAETNLRNINGTGWLPIDFTAGGGAPALERLPVDPINSFAGDSYYTYTCTRNPHYEITARLISEKYIDTASDDGGPNIALYEVGTDLTLTPFLRGGYEEEFGNFKHWTLTGSATVDEGGILKMGAWGDTATSPLIPLNESLWEITSEFYNTATSVQFNPDGGFLQSSRYTDENGGAVQNSGGWTGNGNARAVPLNTWTSWTWNMDSVTNVGITWVQFILKSNATYSPPAFDVRNTKITID